MRSGSTLIHVVQVDAETWDVREPGTEHALSSWFSRQQAVREATAMVSQGRGGEVRVAAADGSVESIGVATGTRPWWQLTRSPRSAFLLGGLWVLLAGVQLLIGASDRGAFQVFTVIMGLMGVATIASGVALRHARR